MFDSGRIRSTDSTCSELYAIEILKKISQKRRSFVLNHSVRFLSEFLLQDRRLSVRRKKMFFTG